ncbi:MAG: hypothetical protein F4X03_09160 [Dehalococcoidia bacterium]|nr:hypothetical protein [Dehalococcoidia bacterium]MYD29061.1 hypothetical protein [Dehalococcoidia bacterium]
MQAGGVNDAIQYEADDSCPPLVALSVGLQGVMLAVAPLVLVVAITSKAGGQDDSYLSWAVFAALIIAGVLTALQATRIGRLGAGHILIMGATPNFVAVSVLALEGGGPSLLASLIVVASLFYLALAIWLPLLRRIITPVVSGTVLMLLAVTILPIALDRVQEVPADAPGATGPTVALITLAIATAMALRASGAWRLWSPLIGIAVGTVVAALFGAYDPQPLLDAAWAGIPDGSEFPGFDFTPGAEFWALLPVFVVITLVGGIKNIGDSVAMQGASRRRPRVTDFRLVQGSLNTNGLGILLSGFAGTPPTTVFSSTSVSLASLTGVASRNVGYVIGAAFVVLALFPKLPALILTIPNPVMGAFLLTAIALLFVAGVRTVIQDGLNARKMLVVGLAFSLGAGIETQTIFDDLIGGTWGRLLDNGLLIGAVAAVVMTLFLDLTSPRTGGRLQSKLHNDSLAEIDAFVREIAGSLGWNKDSTERLRSAAEETLMSLLPEGDDGEAEEAPRLIVVARPETGTVEMEFLAVFDEENLEDRLAYLEEESEGLQEGEISLRLLRHYASSVHHQKYYGLDIVTVQVKGSR